MKALRIIGLITLCAALALPCAAQSPFTNFNGTVFRSIAGAPIPVGASLPVTFTTIPTVLGTRIHISADVPPSGGTWCIEMNPVDPSIASEWFTCTSYVQANGKVYYDAAIPKAGASVRYWRATKKSDRNPQIAQISQSASARALLEGRVTQVPNFSLQGRAALAHLAHNQEVVGGIPAPAPTLCKTRNTPNALPLGCQPTAQAASGPVAFFPHGPFMLADIGSALAPLLAQAGPTTNATVNAIAETGTSVGTPFIAKFAADHPWLVTLLLIVGALRFVLKPIVAALHAWAASTEDPRDDELIAKVESSTSWKWALFVIDWLGSIKPTPKTIVVAKSDIK